MGQIPANPGNVPWLRFMHVINLLEQLYLPLSNALSMRTEYLLKYSLKHWGQGMGCREEGRKQKNFIVSSVPKSYNLAPFL